MIYTMQLKTLLVCDLQKAMYKKLLAQYSKDRPDLIVSAATHKTFSNDFHEVNFLH